MNDQHSIRSALFLSAETGPEAIVNEVGAADAVIFDLEDLVAPSARVAAREGLAERIAVCRGTMGRFVRVNGLETHLCFDDLEAAMALEIDGIVVPKVETPANLTTILWAMTQMERRFEKSAGTTELIAIAETARAFVGLHQFLCFESDRPIRFGLGIGDLGADIQLTVGEDELELAALRSQIVLASRAAGFLPPLDAVFLDSLDDEGLTRSAQRAFRAGFAGKFCLTARQAEIVNKTAEGGTGDMSKARQQLDAYEVAKTEGKGSVSLDGFFVDEPVARRLRRMLDVNAG